MSALPKRLDKPAKLIFKAATEANVPAILFGGAAVNINGIKRDTKDLDINIKSIDKVIFPDSFYTRAGSASNRLTATFAIDTMDAVKCDIAVNADIDKLLPFTSEYDGIRYALPSLLLVDKIRTLGQRARNNDHKRFNDINDIMGMVGNLNKEGAKIPPQLQDWILTKPVMDRFWTVLEDGSTIPKDEVEIYKLLLNDVGVV